MWPKYWSFSFSISPSMNIQVWFPLGLTGLISMQFKGLLRVSSSNKVQKHQFSSIHPSLCPSLTSVHDYWKNHNSDFVGKMMSLLFNMLSRVVIAFLSRSKRLLISWLQSPSAAILEPRYVCSLFLWDHWSQFFSMPLFTFPLSIKYFQNNSERSFSHFMYFIELILLFPN